MCDVLIDSGMIVECEIMIESGERGTYSESTKSRNFDKETDFRECRL